MRVRSLGVPVAPGHTAPAVDILRSMLNQLRPPGRAAPEHPELSPFSANGWNRPLRFLIDDDEVEDCEALDLLRSLATRPSVEVYSTTGSTPYHASVKQMSESNPDSWMACLERGEDFTRTFVPSPGSLREDAEAIAAQLGQPVDSICGRLAIGRYWAEDGHDAIVTAGALFSELFGWGTGISLKSPELALSELGLCLRAHGDYVVESTDRTTVSMSNSFHLAAAVGSLPSYPAWLASALTAWIRGRSTEPYVLLRSSAERLARALRALDYVRVRRRHPRITDAWGELLFFFDVLLLMLDGTLDCLARLFHLVFDVEGSHRRASWDKAEWREELTSSAPEFRTAETNLCRLADVATGVARLRNSVHGPVLSSELHDWNETAITNDYGAGKLLVTEKDAAEVQATCARLGLDRLTEARPEASVQPAILIEPDQFACAITREVIAEIDQLLSDVSPSRLPRPPTDLDLSHELPPAEYQRNARLLATIPALGDDFSDALNIDRAIRAHRH